MMKSRNIVLCLVVLLIIISCKKDTTNNALNEAITTTEELTKKAVSDTDVLKVDKSSPQTNQSNSNQLDTKTPLSGTAWYAFINVPVPDIHNYFIRYAEYHFQESRMEFFANMVNSSKMTDYVMRKDSVFFVNGPYEDFQFKIMDRTENMMKVKAPSGKINTLQIIPVSDLQLSRKERIRTAMIRCGEFEIEEINARFESIDSITIN